MMKRFIQILLILIVALLSSCKNDEYVYPPVRTEFMDALTDDTGRLFKLISDNGETYNIKAREGIDGLTPDSLYRTLSTYQIPDGENSVFLYAAQQVISVHPLPAEKLTPIKTDPVNIQSVWRAGNYINLIVQPSVKEKVHAFHFIDEGITHENGVPTLTLRLFHDQNDDYAAFTREVYLSIPLNGYRNLLPAGAHIKLHINTYKEGVVTREFTY